MRVRLQLGEGDPVPGLVQRRERLRAQQGGGEQLVLGRNLEPLAGQVEDHACEDVRATRAELEAKGAIFSDEIQELGFGVGTMLEVPGADPILVYEPRHPTAHDL